MRNRPPLLVVEDRGEHAGRVEARQAQPVDRAVHADQRRRPHVADEAVVLDRLVRHGPASPTGDSIRQSGDRHEQFRPGCRLQTQVNLSSQ